MQQRLLAVDPMVGVHTIRRRTSGDVKAPTARDGLDLLDHTKRTLAPGHDSFQPLYVLVALLLGTGARVSEGLAVARDDFIDLTGETPRLMIRRTVSDSPDGPILRETTKTGRGGERVVHLPGFVVEALVHAQEYAAQQAAAQLGHRTTQMTEQRYIARRREVQDLTSPLMSGLVKVGNKWGTRQPLTAGAVRGCLLLPGGG